MALMSYGDISPRTAAFAVTNLLTRALPYLQLEKFGQPFTIPSNSTINAKWRRYYLAGATGSAGTGSGAWLSPQSTTPLTEGVTPTGRKLSNTDYSVQMLQYGDFVEFTDVIQDTHEDNVLKEITNILGEEVGLVKETIRFGVLKAGVNVYYANGTARSQVNTPLTLTLQRQAVRQLMRQNTKPITSIVKSTPQYDTHPIEAAYIALCHPDLQNDIRNMAGFQPVSKYGPATEPMEGEMGSVENVRYLSSTIYAPWADAGGAKGTMLSTTGTSADVYPILLLGRDAFGLVTLKGGNAITPMVVNPKPSIADPLAQRGLVSWKMWDATVILQDAFMVRIEASVTA